jgi:hypothetical protein
VMADAVLADIHATGRIRPVVEGRSDELAS